jgi:hypothetical protein
MLTHLWREMDSNFRSVDRHAIGTRRYFYEVIDMTKGTVSSLGSRSASIGTPPRTNIAMYIRALQRFRVGS